MEDPLPNIGRRRILKSLAIAAWARPGLGHGNGDFWNSENPDQWTKQEIERLTTNSPWAKPVSAVVPVYAAGPGPNAADQRNQRAGRGRPGAATPPLNSPAS